jgi:hypothetical protein
MYSLNNVILHIWRSSLSHTLLDVFKWEFKREAYSTIQFDYLFLVNYWIHDALAEEALVLLAGILQQYSF